MRPRHRHPISEGPRKSAVSRLATVIAVGMLVAACAAASPGATASAPPIDVSPSAAASTSSAPPPAQPAASPATGVQAAPARSPQPRPSPSLVPAAEPISVAGRWTVRHDASGQAAVAGYPAIQTREYDIVQQCPQAHCALSITVYDETHTALGVTVFAWKSGGWSAVQDGSTSMACKGTTGTVAGKFAVTITTTLVPGHVEIQNALNVVTALGGSKSTVGTPDATTRRAGCQGWQIRYMTTGVRQSPTAPAPGTHAPTMKPTRDPAVAQDVLLAYQVSATVTYGTIVLPDSTWLRFDTCAPNATANGCDLTNLLHPYRQRAIDALEAHLAVMRANPAPPCLQVSYATDRTLASDYLHWLRQWQPRGSGSASAGIDQDNVLDGLQARATNLVVGLGDLPSLCPPQP